VLSSVESAASETSCFSWVVTFRVDSVEISEATDASNSISVLLSMVKSVADPIMLWELVCTKVDGDFYWSLEKDLEMCAFYYCLN
jgi:hypothetical protein